MTEIKFSMKFIFLKLLYCGDTFPRNITHNGEMLNMHFNKSVNSPTPFIVYYNGDLSYYRKMKEKSFKILKTHAYAKIGIFLLCCWGKGKS